MVQNIREQSIGHNAKGNPLLKALDIAMRNATELESEQRAIIFTKSRRTQNYLRADSSSPVISATDL